MGNSKIAIFQKKTIRKLFMRMNGVLLWAIFITALTDSKDPAQYFKRMRTRDEELKKLTEQGEVQFVPTLKLNIEITGGKKKA